LLTIILLKGVLRSLPLSGSVLEWLSTP